MMLGMGYRSSRIHAIEGVDLVEPESTPGRLRNAVLDIAVLPLILCLPRKDVEVLGIAVPLHYGFGRWNWRAERCVEIALGLRAMSKYDPSKILEVGNVLPLAVDCEHTVVDKYEAGPGVINEDIVDFDPQRQYDLVLSISTLEHVGWDELPQDPDKAGKALEAMSGLGRDLLITIPIGHHPTLAGTFIDGPFDDVVLLRKVSRTADWVARPLEEADEIEYGRPYANGNGILVGLRGDPLGVRPRLSHEQSQRVEISGQSR